MHLSQKVEGVVIEGHKIASGLAEATPYGGSTIKMQMPLFQERGLDLSQCYPGTLNVSIVPHTWRSLAKEPHYDGLKWHASHPAEDFFMFECAVQFRGATYEGWIYYPDPRKKIGFQHVPSTFEVLAPFIPEIAYGDPVVLMLDPDDIQID